MAAMQIIQLVLLVTTVDLTSFELMDEEDIQEAALLHKPCIDAPVSLAWLKCGTRIIDGRLCATYKYLVNLN